LLLICTHITHAAQTTLLIIGDSLSAGYGIKKEQSWVNLLKKRIASKGYAVNVVNDSISGDTSSNGLSRLDDSLKKYKPNIVVIELGGNDGLRGISPQAMQQNLTEMIEKIKASGAKVLMLGVPLPPNYGQVYIERFLTVYQQVAKQQNIPLVQNFIENIGGNPRLMQADGIHPNALAQPVLLDNVWMQLEQLLIKEGKKK
jgi:acyl-CoA thioesterase-1